MHRENTKRCGRKSRRCASGKAFVLFHPNFSCQNSQDILGILRVEGLKIYFGVVLKSEAGQVIAHAEP